MSVEKTIKKRICNILFGWIFAILALFTPIIASTPVFADPETPETTETELTEPTEQPETNGTVLISDFNGDVCKQNLGAVGWLVCPAMNVVTSATDSLYTVIKDLLVIKPLEANNNSPIYIIWKYCLGIANTVFVIFLLVVVFSQITGLGINNYGIKKILPKLIVAAIFINISFLICTLLVDVSNIVGSSLRSIFENIPITIGDLPVSQIPMRDVVGAVLGTAAIAGVVIAVSAASLWMLIPTLLAGLAAIVSGLITIALRQTVVTLLVMISPLAFVCNMLPNTKDLYNKWKNLFKKMLVFYPLFSLLFGASNLAGWAIIASASNNSETGMFMVILGLGVQIMPLFFSWSLMKMSGTFLGDINAKIRSLADKPIATNRAWAESRRANSRANHLANGTTPSASLQRYLAKRKALTETDTKNALSVVDSMSKEYAQRKIAGVDVSATKESRKAASRYTRNAKRAKNYSLISQNAELHAEHVLNNYGNYYKKTGFDRALNEQSAEAFADFGRANFVREIDDENDIEFLTNRFLTANKRDKNNNPVDPTAFERYIASVGGPTGEQRVMGKVIAQAARVESKQRAEFSVLMAKYGHNGYNKQEFRNWLAGYYINDDGWATDKNGKRLKENGKDIELIRGELLSKAPEKLCLYDKIDDHGLYFDMKDQDGNIIARIHRGKGANGVNYDDAAYIKELISNYDAPIGDPINDIYGILSGIHPGDINMSGFENIGLARYSTTIGRALSSYKGNAAWAGSMFLSEIGNRQIKNSAQNAIAILDSIVKTSKPGNLNTQNPASMEMLSVILNPNNWNKIFTEDLLVNAVNINNELIGGEDWQTNEAGEVVLDENGNIKATPVDNPTYEQRMNKIKRKYLFPAMQKILPAFDRLRTSNTADNQKPGTADKQYEFLEMVEQKWVKNPNIPIDVTLVAQDLPNKAREFRDMKHDKNGRPIYNTNGNTTQRAGSLAGVTTALYGAFDDSMDVDMYKNKVFQILSEDPKCGRALMQFNEFCDLNPNATMNQIRDEIENEIIILINQ